MAQAARDAREARRAAPFPTSPAAVADGKVLNLLTLAAKQQQQRLQAKFHKLNAYVWPNGPTGVSFSDAECAALYGRLRAFSDDADWDYKVDPAKGFVRVEWEQFRSWLCRTVQPLDSRLRAAWAAINELLRSKLQAAGILADYYVACWRVVFNLGNTDPDHQDVEAEYDLYAAGSRRCLLSCNDSGQQRPFSASWRPWLYGEKRAPPLPAAAPAMARKLLYVSYSGLPPS